MCTIRVTSWWYPGRIELTSCGCMVGMMGWEGHDRFMWIIGPLYRISRLRTRPPSFVFLWQDLLPLHPEFLREERDDVLKLSNVIVCSCLHNLLNNVTLLTN